MRLTFALLMVAVATASAAQTLDRFPILKPDQLTIDQRKLVETLMTIFYSAALKQPPFQQVTMLAIA